MLGFLAWHIPFYDAEIWRAFLIPLQFLRNFHLNASHLSHFRLHCVEVEWLLFEVCLALYSAVSPLQILFARPFCSINLLFVVRVEFFRKGLGLIAVGILKLLPTAQI